jgi:hypothetical protein
MTMACATVDEQTNKAEASLLLEEYYTRPTLAKTIQRSPRTLARWEVHRIGPPVTKIGRLILYRKSSVLAWLASREQRLQRRGGR